VADEKRGEPVESDELDEQQIAELKGDLLTLRDEISHFLGLTLEGSRPVALDEPIGRLTRMDAMQQQSLTRASRQGLDVRLRQVKAALEAMKREEYGFCRRCGEPTGFRRLKVSPEAPFCIGCQEGLESSG
jgi:DnaK suppressor protein